MDRGDFFEFDFEIDPPRLGSGDKEDLNETRKTSGQN